VATPMSGAPSIWDLIMMALHGLLVVLGGIIAYLFKEIRADVRWVRDKTIAMWFKLFGEAP
jgi:hypothetical protein